MRISDWSSAVCSSDLKPLRKIVINLNQSQASNQVWQGSSADSKFKKPPPTMDATDENVAGAANVDRDALASLSPIPPRFRKETQRGAKQAMDFPRFNLELQKRKMVTK